MSNNKVVQIADRKLKLTNLDKMMFPGISKIDVINYYFNMGGILLPHIQGRPLVLKRYPEGIDGDYFYQKECPKHAPEWVQTFGVAHGEKNVNYVICNDLATLVWLVNLGCLEFHVWRSKTSAISFPDIAVMDLDPSPQVDFDILLKVALLVRQALQEFNIHCYPKTSGSRGIHIFIPLIPQYPFSRVTAAMEYIAKMIVNTYPNRCTIERMVAKRGDKIYLDYLQNSRGKTMAWHYSLRPTPEATVSTPLLWGEIESGNIKVESYNINTIMPRVKRLGDLYQGILTKQQNIDSLLTMIND